MKAPSELEIKMQWLLRVLDLEYRKDFKEWSKPRKFELDFYIPKYNFAIEIQGGTFSKNRQGHSTGMGIHKDIEKLNYATLKGIPVLLFDALHLQKKYQGSVLKVIQEMIHKQIDSGNIPDKLKQ